MTRRTVLLLSWLWVLAALGAYLIQFRDLVGPIIQLVAGS